MANPCQIGNTGWQFSVRAFYNPNLIRRFGSGTFGSGVFGDEDPQASLPQWVEWAPHVFDLTFTRGLTEPNVNAATDTLSFSLLEAALAPIKMWTPPQSLASPTINTPISLTLIDPAGVQYPLVTARLDSIRELHGPGARSVSINCYGTKTSLRTLVMPQTFPQQTIAERLDQVFTEIGYTDGHQPYPAEFDTVQLLRDPEIRTDERQLDAYAICQEASLSAGYFIGTDVYGRLRFTSLTTPEDEPIRYHITDCDGVGRGPVSTRQLWQSDARQVLNVCQVLSVDPEVSSEAVSAQSVLRFGRRNKGFGFPITVAAKDKTTTQTLARAIVDQTAYRVTRVSEVEFHSGVDPDWLPTVARLELDRRFIVHRSQPTEEHATVAVIGYTLTVTNSHIEGVLHSSTAEGAIFVPDRLTTADGVPLTDQSGNYLVT